MNKQIYKEPSSKIAASLSNLAKVQLIKANFTQSLKNYEQAYKTYEKLYENLNLGQHPNLCKALTNLGDYHLKTRNFNQSLDYYQKALNMNNILYKGFYTELEYVSLVVPRYYNSDLKNFYHPKIAKSLHKMSKCCIEYGSTDKGLNYCQEAHLINKILYSQYHKGSHCK